MPWHIFKAQQKLSTYHNYITGNNNTHTHTHTQTQPFYGSLDFVQDNLGEPVAEESFTHSYPSWSSKILTLSASSIYYDPQHPPYSIHALYSLFPQSLSKFSLVYLLAWHPPLHSSYISSPNHYLLFAAHAHTITTSEVPPHFPFLQARSSYLQEMRNKYHLRVSGSAVQLRRYTALMWHWPCITDRYPTYRFSGLR